VALQPSVVVLADVLDTRRLRRQHRPREVERIQSDAGRFQSSSAAGSVSRRSLATSTAGCGTSSAARARAIAGGQVAARGPWQGMTLPLPLGRLRSPRSRAKAGRGRRRSLPFGLHDDRVRASEQDERAEALSCHARSLESVRRHPPRIGAQQTREFSGVRDEHRRCVVRERSSPKRASASTTAGTSRRSSSSRTRARRASLRPSPGPIASAPTRSAASRIVSTASPSRQPTFTGSSASDSTTGSASAGTASVTYPASARRAARPKRQAAPVIPGYPPTTRTDPAMYFVSRGPR
jgi:hypothetical protein